MTGAFLMASSEASLVALSQQPSRFACEVNSFTVTAPCLHQTDQADWPIGGVLLDCGNQVFCVGVKKVMVGRQNAMTKGVRFR